MIDMRKLGALAAAAALWLALIAPGIASQATLVTPSAPLTMLNLASFLDSAFLSVGSCNAGNSAPANGTGAAAFAGECWINTTSNPWVFSYTADGTHWSEFGTLDTGSFAWIPYSNGFFANLGGNFSTAGAFTVSGAFAATLTFSGITNATFPAGTHTLVGLDVSQTFTGNNTFSTGTVNFTGPVEVGGNLMTFPGVAATLAYIGGSQTFTGSNTFNGTSAMAGGGSFAGTFSGTPTFSGNLTFSGVPNLTGLSTGACSAGVGLNASNGLIKVSCPGAAASIQVGTTGVNTAGGTNRLLTEGAVTAGAGTLADTPITGDSSGNLAAVNSLAGNVVATKAQQQAGSSSVNVVTPSQQQGHPSAAKASVNFVGSSGAVNEAYNVSGVVRNSTGNYTVSFTTPFANTNYRCHTTTISGGGGIGSNSISQAVGSTIVQSFTSAGAAADPTTGMSVTCFGTQ